MKLSSQTHVSSGGGVAKLEFEGDTDGMTKQTSAGKRTQAAKELRVNEQKWSKPLMDAGWTAFPSVIIERQLALGLDAMDVNIILHLASYWWTEDNKPHPSKKTIADAMKVHPRTVQRRIADMEKAGLIRRQERRIPGRGSKSNVYHFDGLIRAAAPYAEEKIRERERRGQEDKARPGRKRLTHLRVVPNAKD